MSGGRVENKAKSISCVRSLIGNIFGGVGDVVIEGVKKLFGIDIGLDTTNFDNNLDNTITDVQKLSDRVDDLVLGDIQIQSDWDQSNNTLKDYIKNKPQIPTADTLLLDTTNFDNNLSKMVTTVQILADRVDDFALQSDWNQTDNTIEDFIKNKPTIPDAQIQSDWLQTNIALADYIKNKPDLTETDPVFAAWLEAWAYFANTIILDNSMWGSGNLSQQCVTVQDLADEVNALDLGSDQIQSDWNQTDNTLADYIKNKPIIPTASLVNNQTLTGDISFTLGAKKYQILDPGSANRTVNIISTDFTEGAELIIKNISTTSKITIQIDGVEYRQLINVYSGTLSFVHNGTVWLPSDINEKYCTVYGSGAIGGSGGVSIGNSANGSYTGVAVGEYADGHQYGTALGPRSSTNNQDRAIALGYYSKCERYREFAISADGSMVGKKYRSQISWYGQTTNETITELLLGASALRRYTILASSAVLFKIDVVAVKSDGSQGAGYKIEGVIRRDNANNTVFVGTPVVTVLGEDDTSWDVVVEADNTNEALVVKVTGAAATSITWHAAGYFTEVRI